MLPLSPRDVDRMYWPFAATEKETISEEWGYYKNKLGEGRNTFVLFTIPLVWRS